MIRPNRHTALDQYQTKNAARCRMRVGSRLAPADQDTPKRDDIDKSTAIAAVYFHPHEGMQRLKIPKGRHS